MELRNRFEGLGEENGLDDNSDAERVSGPEVKKSAKKERVLLLSSSHGSHCSKILSEKLSENYEVCGVVKPNARLNEVVESVDKLTSDFGDDDCVIVMAGGNGEDDVDFITGITSGIGKIMKGKDRTRVIINALPQRFDREDLIEKVKLMNKIMHSEVNRLGKRQNQNKQMNFDMERMERNEFTRHGLHLNNHGKKIFCDRMVELLGDFEQRKVIRQVAFLGL